MTSTSRIRTNRDTDDLKVLFIGICIYIVMMLTAPVIGNLWDRHIAPRPFVYATLEVVKEGGEILIDYYAQTTQEVDAVWIASIYDAHDHRVDQRRGLGNYPKEHEVWTWSAFFTNEYANQAPSIPDEPFRVCVRYIAEARDSGVQDETPIYCSSLFDPTKE